MRLLGWFFRLAAFVLLLAFALNNQASVTLNFLFGLQWQGPMALIVLAVFALGCGVGAVGMLPAWWRQRRAAAALRASQKATTSSAPAAPATQPVPSRPNEDVPDGV